MPVVWRSLLVYTLIPTTQDTSKFHFLEKVNCLAYIKVCAESPVLWQDFACCLHKVGRVPGNGNLLTHVPWHRVLTGGAPLSDVCWFINDGKCVYIYMYLYEYIYIYTHCKP